MDEVVRNILELAKRNLERDGWLLPVGFVMKDGSMYPPVALTEEVPDGVPMDGKAYNIVRLGAMAALARADRVLMLWDAAFRTYPKGVDVEALKADELERPLLYPKSMRTEVIVLQSVMLPDGANTVDFVPYKGGDGEPVVWFEEKILQGTGDFDSRFTDIVRKAYSRALEASKEG